jgi:hypothetical protein
MSTIRAATRLISEYVWRLSRLRALAPPGLDSDDGADLVVACLMGELDFAERFQERRQVHPETTAIAPAEAAWLIQRIRPPTWCRSKFSGRC